jgi:hypothetical protein
MRKISESKLIKEYQIEGNKRVRVYFRDGSAQVIAGANKISVSDINGRLEVWKNQDILFGVNCGEWRNFSILPSAESKD